MQPGLLQGLAPCIDCQQGCTGSKMTPKGNLRLKYCDASKEHPWLRVLYAAAPAPLSRPGLPLHRVVERPRHHLRPHRHRAAVG
jgi:hypothetical protein